MFVSVLDPKVTPIRLSSGIVRVFPIDSGIAFVERPLGGVGAIVGIVEAFAGPATTLLPGVLIHVGGVAALATPAITSIPGVLVHVGRAATIAEPATTDIFGFPYVPPPEVEGGVVAIAGRAVVVINGVHITVVRSGSTIFGPDVFHPSLRYDTSVVFRPETGV